MLLRDCAALRGRRRRVGVRVVSGRATRERGDKIDEYSVVKVQDLTPSPFPSGKGRQAVPEWSASLGMLILAHMF
jgi:hypothetical protein